MTVEFHCYGAPPSSLLTPIERAVLQTLRDARGYFRSSGLSVDDIRHRLPVKLSVRLIANAAQSLVNQGFAEVTRLERYRLSQARKDARQNVSNRFKAVA